MAGQGWGKLASTVLPFALTVLLVATPVWVDPAFAGRSDGSSQAPYRTLEEALQSLRPGCGELRLAAGRHRAGLTLPPGCVLQGPLTAILDGGSGPFALDAPAGVTVRGLTIDGGPAGLILGGQSRIDGARLHGQRGDAITVRSGELDLLHADFTSAGSPRAVGVDAGATVRISDSRFHGPYRRAIEARDARLTVDRCEFDGPATAVQQIGGVLQLADVFVGAGTDAAFVTAGVEGAIRRVRVIGHEFGLLIRDAPHFTLEDLYSFHADRAAVALINSTARLQGIHALHPGSYGGFQIIGGEVTVDDYWVHGAKAQAVFCRDATVTLRDGRVTDLTASDESEGDAVHLRGGTVTVQRLLVARVPGACLIADEHVTATLEDVEARGCGVGLDAQGKSTVVVRRLRVTGPRGPAVTAGSGATLNLDGLTATELGGPSLQVDCARNTRVELTGLNSPVPPQPASCLTVK